ncbi:glycosyltransferase family 28 domain-containing protein [Phlyctema vagabunda]|uniref:Glycosyltransferase family 28 domain-containing protein n=1 Tax=Phlyctema vagabunda TaxID=108571 RepID=A0ABR4PJG8_9HELO
MVSGSGKGPAAPEDSESALPPAIIAQAEAAIAANSRGNRPQVQREQSHANTIRRTPTAQSTASINPTVSRLAVPNILSDHHLPEAPPAYGAKHDQLELSQDGFNTKANVTDDGRVNININQKTRKLSDLLVPALRNQLSLVAQEESLPLPPGYIPPALGGLPGQTPPPKLNVVIHVVGSRGDVQPFVALGKTLKATYGHRVRVATHPTFQTFVEENGLEFFSIGGDPSELMAFMVKNPGLMPGFDSLKSGDVGKRRKGMEEIVLGCWRSCIEAGDGLGAPPALDSSESFTSYDAGINMEANPAARPFIADAIIANPPSFAHIHIAEKLGLPLHIMFTMPWSPTQSFPHPLANIQSSNADVNMTNFVSYALVEMMTWQGLGDVINRFRERALGLDPISLIWAPGMLSRLRIPYTYCWSPALIPKPKDWGQHISISGFYFLSLASSYTPEPELAAFLAAGPPPVYIGFGSIVVDDPNAMTKLIFEAVEKTGVRALVSKGWGGLGADALGIPEGVFMLGNVPHDWLFKHVSAVCHHGGAGTTAAGIALGKPTVVVPFFGDQPFWGAMVARAGAGPPPIPYKQLTSDKLAAALQEALKPETAEKAKELGESIREEKGTEVGAKSFHDQMDVDNLRCSLSPSRVAVWRVKRTQTRLSAFAANVLASENLLDFGDLKLYRSMEYETEDGPWDPISGGASALIGTIASLGMGVADFPIEIFKAFRSKKEASSSSKDDTLQSTSPGSLTPRSSISQTQQRPVSNDDSSTEYFPDTSSQVSSSSPYLHSDSQSSHTTPYLNSDVQSFDDQSATTPVTSPTSRTTSHGGSLKHEKSLKQALRGTLSNSCSRSSSRDKRSSSRSGSPARGKEFDPRGITLESAIGAGKGVSRIVGAGLKSPMDFTLGLARGFHNAPKLYGDDTVRPQAKVTDFQSGLKAAGKEFGYGFYDGISGLITQPIRGAEKEGAAGLFKGIGKGIAGVVLKPGAAIWGLPGYTFMGIHKEVRKMFGSSVLNYIIAARTAQGYEDYKTATKEERLDVITRWREHKDEYQSARQKIQETGPEGQGSGHLSPKGFFQTRHLTFDERKKLHAERQKKREEERNKVQGEHGRRCPFCSRNTAHRHTPHPAQILPESQSTTSLSQADTMTTEFEEAIHTSVAATSRGDPEEDLMIERAIRASVRELQSSQGSTLTDAEALDRAIKASINESNRSRVSTAQVDGPIIMTDEDSEHQALLERAIQQSLQEYQITPSGTELATNAAEFGGDEDEDLKKALAESQSSHANEQQASLHAKTEEEIVLEYIKKQSLAEEEHRRAKAMKEKEQEASSADEEALRQAIAESMKSTGESSQ